MEGTYHNFLNILEKEKTPGTAVIKDFCEDPVVYNKILQQIKVPEFMTNITALKGLEIIQGSYFISKPKYIKDE
jgi:hypothetical protein|tara:strand:+ start:367 stop:588 length:222 start_codon:yes stop_codon:yes gene_type:complete